MGSPIAQLLWPFTDSWSQTQMPEEYRTAKPSNVDTLIINGNLDFSTPAENATAELLPLLENGQEVILTDMGHTDDFWTAQPAAAAQLLGTYFDSGEVDGSGFERQPFSFEVSFPGFTVLGKAMIVLPTIIIALLSLVMWRVVVRRRRKKSARSAAPLDASSPRPGAWYSPTAGVVAGVSMAAFALPTWARLPLWAAILVGIGIAVRDYRAERSTRPNSPRSPASIRTERNRYIMFSALLCALLVALWTFTVWWLTAAVAAVGVAVGIAAHERRSAAATLPAPSRSAAVG